MTGIRYGALILALTFLRPAAAFAGASEKRPGQSGELKEIIIEGTPRIEIKGDKPAYNPKFDPSVPVTDFLAATLASPQSSEKLLLNLPDYLPTQVASDIVLTPWRGYLVQPPVLDLLISHPAKASVSSWRLVITDDQGRIFARIKGRGQIPDHLTWDGRGSGGDFLKVGHAYAYSYFVLDKAKIPTYLSGKTLLVQGLVDDRGGRVSLYLDSRVIFKAGPKLSPLGASMMREAQDWLRRSANESLKVSVYGEDTDLAQKQADLLARHIMNALHLREERVTAKGYPLDKARYARTEITAR